MKKLSTLCALGLIASLAAYPQNTAVRPNGSFPTCNVTNISNMDVVYRNYPNLFAISVAGVASDKLSVIGTHASVKRQEDKWIVCPTDSLATTCRIVVRANTPNGATTCGQQTFKVVDLPEPFAYLSYYSDEGKKQYSSEEQPAVSKSALLNPKCKIGADYLDDISRPLVEFRVTGFEVRLPNGEEITCRGNTFNADVLQRLEELPSESLIYIHSISVHSKEQISTHAHPFCIIIK